MASSATAFLAIVALAGPSAFAQSADTILINGRILTVDESFSTVEALAIADGRIAARGTSDEIAALAGPEAEMIDLEGQTVVPGLIDNHFHFTRAVQRWHRQARLDGVSSRAEALEILAAKAASMPAGEWIMVQGGWSQGQFADAPGGFTLSELDAVAPENPLFVQQGYSIVYANSLALEAVGLDPADGAERPAAGLATFQPPYGAFIEAIPPTSPAQLEQNLTDFMRTLNSVGLTGVYSLGRGPEGETELLFARAAEGPLPLRIWETLMFEAADAQAADLAVALIESTPPNQFDGTFGVFGMGEHVYLPFFDLPNRAGPWPAEIMRQYMKLAATAARAGWHIHEHTMMNSSVTDLLDGFEALNENVRMDHLRWTIAHIYDISADNIERAKALGMTLAVHGVAMHGGVRMPLRTIADSGIVFGLGTDATIVSHYQPFVTLGWAVSGLDLAGNRVLDETLTREEALIAHTRSNAYLFFQEENLGSLEVGKQADLVVLDRDYMTVPAAEIMEISPVLTMVGGQVVYEAPGQSRQSGVTGNALAFVDLDGNRDVIATVHEAVFAPRLSPDGTRIALDTLGLPSNTGRIYTAGIDELRRLRDLRSAAAMAELVRLPAVNGTVNFGPAWTPDGRRIVFLASTRDGDSVWTQLADGTGDSMKLLDARSAESWADDGAALTYLTLASGGDYGISLFDLDSGETRIIADLPNSAEHSSAVSPDNRFVAYSSNASGQFEVFIEPLGGGDERTQITTGGGSHPLWSPDGRTLFFNAEGQMMRLPVDPASGLPVGEPEPLPIEGYVQGQYRRQFDLTADGERFLMLFPL